MTVLTDELRHHAGRYYGKYRGKVVDTADERHQGTLSVTVPGVFGPDVVVRARACMPYGHYYVPPVNADVWVEFEAGDTAFPLWVGAWYPESAVPAEARVSPPDSRVIQTPAGHTIHIDDKPDEERILIRHATNAFVSIDANGSILIANAGGSHLHLDAEHSTATLAEQHGNYLAMGDKGTAVVNSEGTTVNVTGNTVHIRAAKVILQATSVGLGNQASEPTIMGNAFKTLWQVLLTHVHPTAMGPSGPSVELQSLQLLPGVHLTSSVVVK